MMYFYLNFVISPIISYIFFGIIVVFYASFGKIYFHNIYIHLMSLDIKKSIAFMLIVTVF